MTLPNPPPDSLPDRFNVAEHFIRTRLEAGHHERPYLLCGEAVLTVGALDAAAHRAAHALASLGLRPGQRLALLLPDGFAFPLAFWGALRAGVVPVPLNAALTPAELRPYLADSGARALLVDAALWPRLAPALADLPRLRHVVTVDARSGVSRPDGGAFPPLCLAALLAAAPGTPYPIHWTHPDAPAFWLYTSGTTGRPKAAVHRQRDMPFVAQTYLRRVLRLRPDDFSFSTPKLSFAYGLGNSLYFPLAAGCAALLQPGAVTARSTFALLARHRPSVFHAVPSLYAELLRLHAAWQAGQEQAPATLPRLEHLRLATAGGESLPPAVLEGWRAAFGVTIAEGVGSTEALHFYLAQRPDTAGRSIVRPGSAGRPVPGYQVRIVTPEGRDAPLGTAGELWVRGASLLAGYWRRPQATRRALREGWLATGDRFRRDAAGDYWFEGREDDLFKVRGSWVQPAEVEQALLDHPAVAACAVVGRRTDSGLAECVACIVPSPRYLGEAALAALATALQAHVAARLAAFKVPGWIEFHAALPRTATGKLRRAALREASPQGTSPLGSAERCR